MPHYLFNQLNSLHIYFYSEIVNVRNDVGLAYQPYSNDKGVKRPHSPITQTDYYKHGGQPQRYLPPSKSTLFKIIYEHKIIKLIFYA